MKKFIEQHPGACVREIWEGLSGDRIVTIKWQTSLILPLFENSERGRGWIKHQLIVKLRVYGDPRCSGEYTTEVTHPHCLIEGIKYFQSGQISLPITEVAVPQCSNPVVVTYKPRKAKAPLKPIQQSLPLFGASAKLHALAIEKGHSTLSEQALLAGTTEYWDSDKNKLVGFPREHLTFATSNYTQM